MWHIVALPVDSLLGEHWQLNEPTYQPFAVSDKCVWFRKWVDELPEYPPVEQTNQEGVRTET